MRNTTANPKNQLSEHLQHLSKICKALGKPELGQSLDLLDIKLAREEVSAEEIKSEGASIIALAERFETLVDPVLVSAEQQASQALVSIGDAEGVELMKIMGL